MCLCCYVVGKNNKKFYVLGVMHFNYRLKISFMATKTIGLIFQKYLKINIDPLCHK